MATGRSLIGVAVVIPDPWGAELERWRESFGDLQAGSIPTHITLLPPTSVSDLLLDDIEEHLDRSAAAIGSFEVQLRGTGTFRPVSPVVFVALASGISGCEALEAEIRTGLLSRAVDFPYHPHVTVAHDLADDMLDDAFARLSDYAACFTVSGFELYVHGDGAWHARRGFTLRG